MSKHFRTHKNKYEVEPKFTNSVGQSLFRKFSIVSIRNVLNLFLNYVPSYITGEVCEDDEIIM
jgi:hypothetical protein